MNAPQPKPAPHTIPAPPPGWDKKPVFVQVENDEKRLTIQFPNIDALADWLTKVSSQ
jgi:hypothetical protein